MSDTPLGKLADSAANRDAVHVAIAPVVAARTLQPGMHVGLVDGEAIDGVPTVGIVDPFLRTPVRKGERFYLCLYPNTVTGMRHHWSHPAFSSGTKPPAMDDRKAFLAEIALNPNDAAPHQIYADWLEEHGEYEEAKKHREWDINKNKAEKWLRAFAETNGADFEDLIAGATSGEGYCFGNDDGPYNVSSDFWHHLELYTGRAFSNEFQASVPFRCAC